MPNLFTLVLQIAVIVVTSRVMGILFRKMRQPQVVGEMFAGILLGPSLLGWVWPHASTYLFPATSMGALNALSEVGLTIFMFLIGLGINPQELKGQGHAALLISHVSITAPFVLASGLALYLYPKLSDSSVGFTGFALFMGAAMSMTAFPVLARILTERQMLQSRLGTVAVACAAVGDVTGWAVLAYIVVLVRAHHSARPLWVTLAGAIGFGAFMILGVRQVLWRFHVAYKKRERLSEDLMALILILALFSALCTEYLGLHLLFGAFLMGAILPKERKFVQYILDRFETVTVVLLLPLFFAYTGLRTSIGLVHGPEMWMYCGLITLVAIVGKMGGTMISSRLGGLAWRESAGLGALMNTRGLMELVILNVGLDIKVISPALFSMMVVMALVTTFMTVPLLELICPAHTLTANLPVEFASQDAVLAPLSLESTDTSAA
ncbi:MAG TPA: cation:proton antiporter [Terriglobales bacterium]|nr:cation:proton antiporter [Terriglobales bacterium]